jgi:phytoene dehydrogenase-like protein
LVKAMADTIKSKGGAILTNTPAKRILVENNRVRGVLPEYGNAYEADVVIASGGARECFFQLVGRDNLTPEYVSRVENSMLMESALMVHLGLDLDPSRHQRSALGSYLGTYDVVGHVVRSKKGIFHEGNDGFLIYVPSMHSPSMAPPGHHAVTIYTIAPNKPNQGNWGDIKEEMADKLLACAEKIVPGLRERSTTRVILTPEDFSARTHLKHHSYGGLAPVMGQPGPPHKTPIKGLWFVGAQSEGLGGIPNVISATAKVAKGILE